MASRRKPPPRVRPKTPHAQPKAAQVRSKTAQSQPKAIPGLTPASGGLGNIRESIDAIDARIHALLNERARFAQLVGISNLPSGKAGDFYRPEREAEVLRLAL